MLVVRYDIPQIPDALHPSDISSSGGQGTDLLKFSINKAVDIRAYHLAITTNKGFLDPGSSASLYDQSVLKAALVEAGIEDLKSYKPAISDDESLRRVEARGDVIGSEKLVNSNSRRMQRSNSRESIENQEP